MQLLDVKDALPVGYALHWYEIKGVLGRGGFGITYLARDKNLDVNVAIKEYFPVEYASREGHTQSLEATTADQNNVFDWGLDKFVGEAQTLAKFSHRNIVRVTSVFKQNNSAYMVMDLEEGLSLAEVISQKQRFSEAQLTGMLVGLMDGLEVVHRKGFIHRDIKPANIIVRPNGEPVVLDFGSARGAMKDTANMTSLVSYGYTPFEQYHAAGDQQGPWTDVYALAATFHHLILGAKPTEAMTRANAIMNDKPDPLLAMVSCEATGLSREFLAVLDAGLVFKADKRPQSMVAWKSLLGSKAQQAKVVPPPLQVTSGEATVLMDSSQLEGRTAPRMAMEPEGKGRSHLGLLVGGAAAVCILVAAGSFWWLQGQKDKPVEVVSAPVTKPKVDPELLKLKEELQRAKQEADSIAQANAKELEALKAERLAAEEAMRKAEAEAEAKRLADEKRQAEEARKRKLAADKRNAEAARKRALADQKAKLRKDAEAIVQQFKADFQGKNAESLFASNEVSDEKRIFAEQLFSAYQAFNLESKPLTLEASASTAKTTITIESIRAKNGSVVRPSASWRNMSVVIKPTETGELKLSWY